MNSNITENEKDVIFSRKMLFVINFIIIGIFIYFPFSRPLNQLLGGIVFENDIFINYFSFFIVSFCVLFFVWGINSNALTEHLVYIYFSMLAIIFFVPFIIGFFTLDKQLFFMGAFFMIYSIFCLILNVFKSALKNEESELRVKEIMKEDCS